MIGPSGFMRAPKGREGVSETGDRPKLIGLQIICPNKGKVTVRRADYAIGPISDPNNLKYKLDCPCGEYHEIPVRWCNPPKKR